MKKLILVVTIAVLGIFACKKENETPAPIVKKYEYKRTSGEVTKIEGDIFVDTGGTVFTVKGKGFDPKKKKYYHLLLENYCGAFDKLQIQFNLNGYATGANYVDTAKVVQITDSTIKYVVNSQNLYSVRRNSIGTCIVLDSVRLLFAVTSIDSSNKSYTVTQFDRLFNKNVKNKFFFNIVADTVYWYTKLSIRKKSITLDDICAVGGENLVDVYFNGIKLNTSSRNPYCFSQFETNESTVGDGFFLFDTDFYNSNKNLGLTDGFYNITMMETRTGIPIEEKRGRKGAYVKFIN